MFAILHKEHEDPAPIGEAEHACLLSDPERDLLIAARCGQWPGVVWVDPDFIEDAQADEAYTLEQIEANRARYMEQRQTLLDNLRRALTPSSVTAPLIGIVQSDTPPATDPGKAPDWEDFPDMDEWQKARHAHHRAKLAANPHALSVLSQLKAMLDLLADDKGTGEARFAIWDVAHWELPRLSSPWGEPGGTACLAASLFGEEVTPPAQSASERSGHAPDDGLRCLRAFLAAPMNSPAIYLLHAAAMAVHEHLPKVTRDYDGIESIEGDTSTEEKEEAASCSRQA